METRDDRRRQKLLGLIEDAVAQTHRGDACGRVDGLLDRLTNLDRAWAAGSVADAMVSVLEAAVHESWHRGWQPADLVGAVAKRVSDEAATLVALTVSSESRSIDPAVEVPARWAQQLTAIEQSTARLVRQGCATSADFVSGAAAPAGARGRRSALRTAVLVITILRSLPALPHLLPEPCAWRRVDGSGRRAGPGRPTVHDHDLDPAMLAKVQALLAKAESTTFEAEAMAFTAKAQELMTRHAIDQAVLDRRHGIVDEPEARRVRIDDPYATERSMLLGVIAASNRCQAVWSKDLGFATILGFAADLDTVELLYASLLVQATAIMAAHGPQTNRAGRSTTRSFRQSFLVGFADRIGRRLEAATAATFSQVADEQAGAGDEPTSAALVPLFAERRRQVDDAATEMFPGTTVKRVRVGNRAGMVAGALAAEQASLAMGQALDA